MLIVVVVVGQLDTVSAENPSNPPWSKGLTMRGVAVWK
jgi:hypothetical protein